MSKAILSQKLKNIAAMVDCPFDFLKVEFTSRRKHLPKCVEDQEIVNEIYADFVESFMY